VFVRLGECHERYRALLGPDLAVVRLANGGPEIEAECKFAESVEPVQHHFIKGLHWPASQIDLRP
jgi:hypothetical protein